MTRILRTENSSPMEWRDATFSHLGNFWELSQKPWSQLKQIEILPGYTLGSKFLVVPEHWLAMNPTRQLNYRTVTPALLGPDLSPATINAHDESLRRALLALWLPGMTGKGVKSWNPGTWVRRSDILISVAQHIIDNLAPPEGRLFGNITLNLLSDLLLPAMGGTDRLANEVELIMRRLIDAGERGVLLDWPERFYHRPQRSDVPTTERIVVGAPEILFRNPTPERSWQPFSDLFVTEFVSRAVWIFENIAAQAMNLWLELQTLPKVLGVPPHDPRLLATRRKIMEEYKWTDAAGRPLTELPFILRYRDGETAAWPPLTSRNLTRISGLIQSLNVSIIALCTGARSSEIAAAKDTPIQGSNDRLYSLTFKFSDRLGGIERDWPLHPIATRALRLQQKMSRGIRPDGTDYLWFLIQRGLGGQALNLTEPLVNAVDFLSLDHLTGDDRAHLHRWRHTVARLIAVAVTSAPQVIMDLFGHSDLEKALTYMCSDPEIVETALSVAKEIAAVVTGEAIADVARDEASGRASDTISAALVGTPLRRGETEFATEDLQDTIKMMTFSDIEWKLVRPGVLCTKTERQFGPCTRTRGSPDPGSCRTTCDYRLETAKTKRDCRSMLDTLVAMRREAVDNGEAMITARLDGEISSHLQRWQDIRSEFITSNPELAALSATPQ